MRIPIQNIYYLLCYAWNKLDERDVVDVQTDDCNNIIDLLAKVLLGATTHLLKRGLDRGYINHHEDRSCLRGKIGFAPSLRRNLFVQGKAHCHFDDLHYNIPHNQILKSAIRKLILHKGLDHNLKEQLLLTYRRFHGIDDVELSAKLFRSVQLHRNNFFYDFPLRICELIHENLLAADGAGESRFREFLRDETKMGQLFEGFVRNFYRLEQAEYHVSRNDIEWQATELSEGAKQFLPKMQTDITLESLGRKIIIDTKYYKEALQTHHGKKTVHSGHLFQLFSYLKNISVTGESQQQCEGMLLYPSADDQPLDLQYEIHGHKVSVRSINLNQEWRGIHRDLLGIVC